jgi:uncharacterized protein YebE (UPF0316 family)
LGYRGVQAIIDKDHGYIVDELRNQGYPVTSWDAQGLAGCKIVMNLFLKRQLAREVTAKISAMEPDAFVVFMEPKHFRGGYLKKK